MDADVVVIGAGALGLSTAPHCALAPGRFGALTDAELVARGVWQYAHYYDPPDRVRF